MFKEIVANVAGAVGSAVGTVGGTVVGVVVGAVVGACAGFSLGDRAARQMVGETHVPDEHVVEAVAAFEEAVEHVVTKRRRAPKGVAA